MLFTYDTDVMSNVILNRRRFNNSEFLRKWSSLIRQSSKSPGGRAGLNMVWTARFIKGRGRREGALKITTTRLDTSSQFSNSLLSERKIQRLVALTLSGNLLQITFLCMRVWFGASSNQLRHLTVLLWQREKELNNTPTPVCWINPSARMHWS